MSKDKRKDDVIMNEMITVKEVRCTGDDGTNYGIISTAEALQTADSLGLDLVLIAPDGKPPVAKIMDYHMTKKDSNLEMHNTINLFLVKLADRFEK